MIENLKVSYIKNDELQVTLAPVAEVEENLPYELAGLFAQIIEDSQVNRELVLKELADNLFCNIELKKDAEQNSLGNNIPRSVGSLRDCIYPDVDYLLRNRKEMSESLRGRSYVPDNG